MKKIFLLALSFFAYTGFAQTVLWNGETATNGVWPDGSPVTVDNPEKDGVNTSDKCLKFTMTNDSKVIKINFIENVQTKLNGSTRVSLMIRKPVNENVKIELSNPWDGSDDYWEKVAAYYSGNGKWQKVVFDFASNPTFDRPGLISITAQTADVTEAQDVYIDNIVLEPATKVNGKLLSEVADGSLSGNVKLTGAWMKGDCQNANGEWKRYDYDDFTALKAKLSPYVTSIDMTQDVVLKDAYNAFLDVNPNIIVYADEAVNGDNVAINGVAGNVVIKQDGTFSKGAEGAQVTAFGAYWDVPGAASLRLETSTGITGVEADGGQMVDVYTIGGVKVRTAEASTALDGLAKGVYIVAGKKYVVR